ncbi:centromere protein L-like [Haliotis rufescens]|uniref:centromere protein L-like n=1 Tax=Haliotis rufescens TaxID=6454 RepID=UPI00201F0E40|nr:centromere protein L-like [Haliotis rufescens]XP_046359936.2 centromere protein L-like [Haliotis rufescens]XP_046359938.2 centromere protein L-like [Haliotis rufescens]XP_046359939.2 centromere protein L-like [Haliotis rufescens]
MDGEPASVIDQTPSQVSGVQCSVRTSGSTRKNTPYHKTPRSRRFGLQGSKSPLIEKTPTSPRHAPSFKGLVNKTWKLYRLSPLYNFTPTPSHLRRYGTSLSVLVGERQRRSLITESKDLVRSLISPYRELTIGPDDPECIQILITGKTLKDIPTTLVTGFMFGVELQDSLVSPHNGHFKHYPVLMVKGSMSLCKALTDWLESKFDCRVSAMTFSSVDLSWMVAMWSGLSKGLKSKPVELLYTVPEEVEGLKKITYSIDAEDCQRLWDSIHDGSSNEFTEEEVKTFMDCLQSHFYGCFKVHLSSMFLTRIGTSIVYVGSDGKIKFFTESGVIPVLRYISELSVEKSKIL